jgi:hypothetical protein
MLVSLNWQGVPRLAQKKEDISNAKVLLAFEVEKALSNASHRTKAYSSPGTELHVNDQTSGHVSWMPPQSASLHSPALHLAGNELKVLLMAQGFESFSSFTIEQRITLYSIAISPQQLLPEMLLAGDVTDKQLAAAVRRKVKHMAEKGSVELPTLVWDGSLGGEERACMEMAGRMCMYFKAKLWYMDIISSFLRLIISSVIIFITTDPYVQFGAMLTLLLVVFVCAAEFKPYTLFVLNLQQIYTTAALFIIVLYGLLQYQLSCAPSPNAPLQVFSSGSTFSVIVVVICISVPFAPALVAFFVHIVSADDRHTEVYYQHARGGYGQTNDSESFQILPHEGPRRSCDPHFSQAQNLDQVPAVRCPAQSRTKILPAMTQIQDTLYTQTQIRAHNGDSVRAGVTQILDASWDQGYENTYRTSHAGRGWSSPADGDTTKAVDMHSTLASRVNPLENVKLPIMRLKKLPYSALRKKM